MDSTKIIMLINMIALVALVLLLIKAYFVSLTKDIFSVILLGLLGTIVNMFLYIYKGVPKIDNEKVGK